MNLKRQVYHKGALVGNDVAKILHPENVGKIVNCFKPLRVNLPNGEHKVFSDQSRMNKVSTLLTKLSQCFQLYSPCTPLCRHEVAFLAVWCASFGYWFPIKFNFPKTSLLRKFYVLTFHVPEKAISKHTVGMEAEHCSESIHPLVNRLERTYLFIYLFNFFFLFFIFFNKITRITNYKVLYYYCSDTTMFITYLHLVLHTLEERIE